GRAPVPGPHREEAARVTEDVRDLGAVRRVVPDLVVVPEVAPLVVPLVLLDLRGGDLRRRRADVELAAERRIRLVLRVAVEERRLVGPLEADRVVPRSRGAHLTGDARGLRARGDRDRTDRVLRKVVG